MISAKSAADDTYGKALWDLLRMAVWIGPGIGLSWYLHRHGIHEWARALGFILVVLEVLAVVALTYIRLRMAWHADAYRTLAEFEKRFPGRCPICSYHRYGLQEGHVRGDCPPHDCIEEGDNWRGVRL